MLKIWYMSICILVRIPGPMVRGRIRIPMIHIVIHCMQIPINIRKVGRMARRKVARMVQCIMKWLPVVRMLELQWVCSWISFHVS